MYTIWRFDGSGGCEKCQEYTGDYPYNPGLPHDYCDCSLTEITIDEVCNVIDKWTIEMVMATFKWDWGPGPGYDTRILQRCYDLMVYEYKYLECCKVENGVVTDNCYCTERENEYPDWRCDEPFIATEV